MIIASRETIKKLHRRPGVLLQVHRPRAIQAYDPDEPRDNHGRWSEEGGSGNQVETQLHSTILRQHGFTLDKRPPVPGESLQKTVWENPNKGRIVVHHFTSGPGSTGTHEFTHETNSGVPITGRLPIGQHNVGLVKYLNGLGSQPTTIDQPPARVRRVSERRVNPPSTNQIEQRPTANSAPRTPVVTPDTTKDEVIERKPVGLLSQDPSTFLSNKSEGERERILRSNNITNDSLVPSKGLLEEFEQNFKMDVVQFKSLLTKGVNFETNMNLIKANYMEIKGVNGEFYMRRKFLSDSQSVHHNYFLVLDKGKGLGKALFNNSLDLYDHIGINNIKTQANIDVGGYAWARFGFVPNSELQWNSLRGGYRGRDQHVKEFCKSADPKSMWGIAATAAGREYLLGKHWFGILDLTDKDSYTVSRKYCMTSKGKGK